MIHDLKQEQMTPEERNQLAIEWIQENAPDYVLQQYIGLKKQRDALRTAYQTAAAIMRSQPVGIAPRLVQAWREAVDKVEAVTK